ncbi:cornifelin-like [Conger conger]|uniref:cornifelin-like n=1 Tax=Conger conger TaxID=82655 RepID=UPI002A5A87A2|nr:cornifelin-like [Conger conger]
MQNQLAQVPDPYGNSVESTNPPFSSYFTIRHCQSKTTEERVNTMATNVVIQQSQVPTVMAGQFNDWSTGICECFDDMAICCFGYWCPLCFACKTSTDFGECVCLPVMDSLWTITICFGVPTCVPPVAFAMRVGARNRYNIQGDMCTDCITATFCNTCSWCQIAREIKRHKRNMTVVNAQPNVIAPVVINSTVMQAPPPVAPVAPVIINNTVR